MSGSNVADLVIGILVVVLLVVRQLMKRPLSESYRLSVILAVIGLVEFVTFLSGHPGNDGKIVVAVIGSLVLAAIFGAARVPGRSSRNPSRLTPGRCAVASRS